MQSADARPLPLVLLAAVAADRRRPLASLLLALSALWLRVHVQSAPSCLPQPSGLLRSSHKGADGDEEGILVRTTIGFETRFHTDIYNGHRENEVNVKS